MSLRFPAESGGARPARPKYRPRPVETPAFLPAALRGAIGTRTSRAATIRSGRTAAR